MSTIIKIASAFIFALLTLLLIDTSFNLYWKIKDRPSRELELRVYNQDLHNQMEEVEYQMDSIQVLRNQLRGELLADSLNKATEMPIKYPY